MPELSLHNTLYRSPFGMLMPDRSFSTGYRFGFNGKETIDEVLENMRFYDYGFRMYYADLGRFISLDPLASKYSHLTPYQFSGNTPIRATDLDGLEPYFDPNLGWMFDPSLSLNTNVDIIERVRVGGTSYNSVQIQSLKSYYQENYQRRSSGASKGIDPKTTYQDCITSFCYGQNELQDIDLTRQSTAANAVNSLINKGYIQPSNVRTIEFNDIGGKSTTNTGKQPYSMVGSVASEAISLTGGEKGQFVYQMSLLDGYHTMTLVLDNSDPSKPTFSLADHTSNTKGWLEGLTSSELDTWVTSYSNLNQDNNVNKSGSHQKTQTTISQIDDKTPVK